MSMLDETIFAEDGLDLSLAVDKILKRCVQETIDINSLLGSDKFFLFMMLRAVTYGPEYTFEWTCTKETAPQVVCGHVNTTTINIPNDFKMKYLGDDDSEPFEIVLPESGKDLSFRLLRGHDEEAVKRFTEEIEEKRRDGIQALDTTGIFRLSRHVLKVEGNDATKAPRDMVMNFLASLGARDRQHLKDKIRFYTPGLDTGLKLKCDKCKFVHSWDMPLTADFFRAVNDDEGDPVADEVRFNVLPGDGS